MQRCVKRWDPFGDLPRIGAADTALAASSDTEVLSWAVLLVSRPLMGSLLHNITTGESEDNLAAQKRTVVCPNRKRARTL
jgi:hypothetical protein